MRYSNLGSTLTAVNFPEVSLTDHPGMHRIIHIHQNRPGLLSQINAVFSRHNVNICSQFLETHANVGYVVADVEAKAEMDTKTVREELEQIDGTIRTRLLHSTLVAGSGQARSRKPKAVRKSFPHRKAGRAVTPSRPRVSSLPYSKALLLAFWLLALA